MLSENFEVKTPVELLKSKTSILGVVLFEIETNLLSGDTFIDPT